ncbi:hypothetical protein C8R47DRAFT_1165543 [Mycena vitilis]|nr:hypothetical protein C8R47DRAFT_1165543 [Mycena vitilis]
MVLNKVADDEWTLTGVKSTFTIQIPKNPSSAVSGTQTAICGWGWRFSCDVGAASTDASPRILNADSSIIPWRRVAIYFHPDLIRSASYGRITLHTSEEVNLLPLDLDGVLFQTELNLPDDSLNTTPPLGIYMYRSDAGGPARISITVQFATGLGMALPRPRDGRVEAVLAETIRGEEAVDVKFYVYTRAGEGYVTRPQALFAKMTLLRGHSEPLDNYICGVSGAGGFAASELVDLDADAPPEEQFEEYDYMSDSDLEDEEDGEEQTNAPSNVASASSSSTGEISFTVVPGVTINAARRMGRVVPVKGHAFKTWNALLHYLYINKINFRSSPSGESASRMPECSVKSMYKLADKFALEELKSCALESMRAQLSEETIMREAFSTFTSLYPEIQDMEVEFLLQHLPNLREGMGEMLRSVCDGRRPHCFNMLYRIVCRAGLGPAAEPFGQTVPNPAMRLQDLDFGMIPVPIPEAALDGPELATPMESVSSSAPATFGPVSVPTRVQRSVIGKSKKK